MAACDDASSGTLVARYPHDGLNRRVRKFTDTDTGEEECIVTEYYYNSSWQLLETQTDDTAKSPRGSGDPPCAWRTCSHFWLLTSDLPLSPARASLRQARAMGPERT